MVDPKRGGASPRPGPSQGPKGGGGASPRPGPPQGPKGGGGAGPRPGPPQGPKGGGGAGPSLGPPQGPKGGGGAGPPQSPKPAPAVGLQLPVVQTYTAEEDLAFFITATDGSTALQGKSVGTGRDGGSGQGVCGLSDVGTGVQGDSGSGVGVFGNSNTQPGVLGTSKQLDGVQGQSQSAQHAGVSGSNHSGGMGVYGFSSKLDGVQGISTANDHAGVSGTNNSGGDDGMGVYGYSSGSDGVRGISGTQAHAGVSGKNTSGGIGVYGASTGEAGHFDGNVTINGMLAHNGDGHCSGTFTVANDIVLLGLGQDCAEQFEVNEAKQLEPGTVVVIDREGALRESYAAYDKKVAGVVSGAGPCRPGIILGKRASEAQSAHVALVGKVYCKVDAHYSPIDVGDLLTTSPTPGYAMRADDPQKAFGAVIGKSLCPLGSGKGLIPILVALQ